MPIYEFKCQKCDQFFELLMVGKSDEEDMKCPKCGAQSFERVISRTNFSVSGGTSSCAAGPSGRVGVQERTCSTGSCTTYTIPGSD